MIQLDKGEGQFPARTVQFTLFQQIFDVLFHLPLIAFRPLCHPSALIEDHTGICWQVIGAARQFGIDQFQIPVYRWKAPALGDSFAVPFQVVRQRLISLFLGLGSQPLQLFCQSDQSARRQLRQYLSGGE